MKKKVYVAAITLLATMVVTDANAGQKNISENDAHEVLAAPVSFVQAISIAEKELAGKASQGDIEISDGKLIYEIEIVTENAVMDVAVDARNGQLLSSKPDKIDSEDNDMEERDDHEERDD